MEFYPLLEEFKKPEDEYTTPAEFTNDPGQEFGGRSDSPERAERPPRHRVIKRLLLMPAAATVAALSVFFAALSYDPLGSDFLSSSSSSPVPPASSFIPTIPPAESGDPVGEITIYIHVTYVPTSELYTPDSTGAAAMKDAVAWVESKGGDGTTMKYVRSVVVYTGYEASDDAVIVGDPDDIDNAYIAQGTITKKYRRDVYYDAYATGASIPSASGDTADTAFPSLSNPDPDFAGNYAWSSMGSEEYVRFTASGATSYTYLEAGSVWVSSGADVTTSANAAYDAKTNTLTLTNFTADLLDINLMGNGFKIKLTGDNSIGSITVWGASYGGSVTFTGDGKLTVNKDKKSGIGILLNSEMSGSCIMIDKDVTLEVYGDQAMIVSLTTLDPAIYYLSPQSMSDGKRSSGEFLSYTRDEYDDNGSYVGSVPVTLKEISDEKGVTYYDFSITDENGDPVTYVKFSPYGK